MNINLAACSFKHPLFEAFNYDSKLSKQLSQGAMTIKLLALLF